MRPRKYTRKLFAVRTGKSVSYTHLDVYKRQSLQCSEGVTVESVVYDRPGVSEAKPTEARGCTWFSFFSSGNTFSGKTVATVTLSYSGSENTCVVLRSVSVYTKEGRDVEKELLQPDKVIALMREGADNPVIPPEVPTEKPSAGAGTEASEEETTGQAPKKDNPHTVDSGLSVEHFQISIIFVSFLAGIILLNALLACLIINIKSKKKEGKQ